MDYLASDYSDIAVEESRLSIDYERRNAYEMIRELNSSRNELTPISTLPPDLLGKIFTFVIAEQPTGGAELVGTVMFNFTHVSRKWRYVALNTPGLWDTPHGQKLWATFALGSAGFRVEG